MALQEDYDHFTISQALEPYQIGYKTYKKDEQWLLYVIFPVLWLTIYAFIREMQLNLVRLSSIFASNYPYSTQCLQIQNSFAN